MSEFDIVKDVQAAESRIRPYIRETPLEYSPSLSEMGNCNVYLKLENLQVTGSFKIRGAANFILSLTPEQKERPVVTASTGNHALAVAYLLDRLGINGIIYLPENTPEVKLAPLRHHKVELRYHGTDCVRTEVFAREIARQQNQAFIPPYNHPKIIAGQATIALELQRQCPAVDAVFVPVGGGGLISGIAAYLKEQNQGVEIIGCQPENSPVMYESIKAGRIIEMVSRPTLADGTAGGIERGAITFDFCKKYVDEYVLDSEEEIKKAILYIIEKHHMLIEGAAALSVASFLKSSERFEQKNVVLVLTGKRISLDQLKEILCDKKDKEISDQYPNPARN